jgi:hypothetical protein
MPLPDSFYLFNRADTAASKLHRRKLFAAQAENNVKEQKAPQCVGETKHHRRCRLHTIKNCEACRFHISQLQDAEADDTHWHAEEETLREEYDGEEIEEDVVHVQRRDPGDGSSSDGSSSEEDDADISDHEEVTHHEHAYDDMGNQEGAADNLEGSASEAESDEEEEDISVRDDHSTAGGVDIDWVKVTMRGDYNDFPADVDPDNNKEGYLVKARSILEVKEVVIGGEEQLGLFLREGFEIPEGGCIGNFCGAVRDINPFGVYSLQLSIRGESNKREKLWIDCNPTDEKIISLDLNLMYSRSNSGTRRGKKVGKHEVKLGYNNIRMEPSTEMIAITKINGGDEILWDYGASYFSSESQPYIPLQPTEFSDSVGLTPCNFKIMEEGEYREYLDFYAPLCYTRAAKRVMEKQSWKDDDTLRIVMSDRVQEKKQIIRSYVQNEGGWFFISSLELVGKTDPDNGDVCGTF